MKPTLKALAIILGIVGIILGGLYFAFDYALGETFKVPEYSEQDMINHFEKKENEITKVQRFISRIVQEGMNVEIEFEDDELNIFHLQKNGVSENNWDLKVDSKKTDSLLKEIGWTRGDLLKLKELLSQAGCISASNGNPTTIGWQRSGMGMYFYKLFDENLSDSLIEVYDESCSSIYYQENVVFSFATGVFGSDCFPK